MSYTRTDVVKMFISKLDQEGINHKYSERTYKNQLDMLLELKELENIHVRKKDRRGLKKKAQSQMYDKTKTVSKSELELSRFELKFLVELLTEYDGFLKGYVQYDENTNRMPDAVDFINKMCDVLENEPQSVKDEYVKIVKELTNKALFHNELKSKCFDDFKIMTIENLYESICKC